MSKMTRAKAQYKGSSHGCASRGSSVTSRPCREIRRIKWPGAIGECYSGTLEWDIGTTT